MTRIPDWYHGYADRVLRLRAAPNVDDASHGSAGLTGYLSALFMADLIHGDARMRMETAGLDALRRALQDLSSNQSKEA